MNFKVGLRRAYGKISINIRKEKISLKNVLGIGEWKRLWNKQLGVKHYRKKQFKINVIWLDAQLQDKNVLKSFVSTLLTNCTNVSFTVGLKCQNLNH